MKPREILGMIEEAAGTKMYEVPNKFKFKFTFYSSRIKKLVH